MNSARLLISGSLRFFVDEKLAICCFRLVPLKLEGFSAPHANENDRIIVHALAVLILPNCVGSGNKKSLFLAMPAF